MTERLHFHFSLSCIGEGNGNPLQYSCLENPRDGGAWRAAVYGVGSCHHPLNKQSSFTQNPNELTDNWSTQSSDMGVKAGVRLHVPIRVITHPHGSTAKHHLPPAHRLSLAFGDSGTHSQCLWRKYVNTHFFKPQLGHDSNLSTDAFGICRTQHISFIWPQFQTLLWFVCQCLKCL